MSKILVAYFSAGGRTRNAAQLLAEAAGADLYEITPKEPYTKADLNWMNKKSRSSVEMNDSTSRPEITDTDAHVEDYDVIFLGFPIWWYTAPTIVRTFLEKYDFSGKTIVLFATSGSSGMGNTARDLESSVSKTASIIEGEMLNGRQSVEGLKRWLGSLDL